MEKKPKFAANNFVAFISNRTIKDGIIENLDFHAFGYNEIVYDIYVEYEQCLYKHVKESDILKILDSIENEV